MSLKLVPVNYKHTNWGCEYNINYRVDNLKFIHIGKCGGTAINQHFFNAGIMIAECHLCKPTYNHNDLFFIWIRNPIKRFVSAFNHSKNILNFDLQNSDSENLNLDNCPAPAKISSRIRTGIAFSKEYDELVCSFEMANDLAESLSSSNSMLREKALRLMNHPMEHIYKGIGWYLDNGFFIEEYYKQMAFIGRVEYMTEDFDVLSNRIGFGDYFKSSTVDPLRVGNKNLSKYLSNTAVET